MKLTRQLSILAFAALIFGFASAAHAAKYKIVHSYPLGGPKLGETTLIQFSIYRGSAQELLVKKDFEIEHEKLIHMMVIDSGFQEYLHEHPEEVSPGVWQVPVTIKTPGNYRFFLQFRPEGELTTKTVVFDDKYSETATQVVPTSPVHPEERLTFVEGDLRVSLNYLAGQPVQKKISPVYFKIEKNGVKIPIEELDNYLGTKMHIAAISADKADFVHAHPGDSWSVDEPTAQEITKVYFQQSGYYGLFMQFSYKGVVHTTQFALQVAKP